MKTRESKGVAILENRLFFIGNSKQHLHDTKNFFCQNLTYNCSMSCKYLGLEISLMYSDNIKKVSLSGIVWASGGPKLKTCREFVGHSKELECYYRNDGNPLDPFEQKISWIVWCWRQLFIVWLQIWEEQSK